jgi:hypothetical protein
VPVHSTPLHGCSCRQCRSLTRTAQTEQEKLAGLQATLRELEAQKAAIEAQTAAEVPVLTCVDRITRRLSPHARRPLARSKTLQLYANATGIEWNYDAKEDVIGYCHLVRRSAHRATCGSRG